MTVSPLFGEPRRGDVINVTPPQKAGAIAEVAGLTNNGGWCPVDQRTFESRVQKDIHVIGDAAIASPMPFTDLASRTLPSTAPRSRSGRPTLIIRWTL